MSASTPSVALDQAAASLSEGAPLRVWVQLLKPRVMSLVVLSGVAGLVAAPGGLHPLLAAVAVICIAVGAGASGVINMWYDRDIDAVMARTRRRPLAMAQIEPAEALSFGVVLALFSVMLMGLAVNWLAAGLLALTIGFYVFVYTMWLKRRTPQNIVIGGAAGAFPPVVAWAAATGEMPAAAWAMFAIVFLWTPPHFWALALWRARDYRSVSVPMLPVVAGDAATRRQIAVYALILAPVAVLAAFTEAGGPLYFAAATVMSVRFAADAIALARRDEATAEGDGWRAEKRLFGFSIVYLFVLFAAFMLDAALASALGALGVTLAWPVWI